MANSPSKITRSTSLADLLATVVAGGTYSDVIETAKVDAAGQEAAAADIAENAGEIWSNLVDDSIQRVVQMYDRGTKVWLPADATARDALGSNDDLEADAIAMLADTKALYYCVSVDGGSASTWAALPASGNISGPGVTTDNAVVRWDGALGGVVQNSVVVISDAGAITGVASIAVSGNVDGRDVSADGATLDAHVASIANPHTTLLSQTLAADNRTDGNNVEVTNGDEINGEDGGYVRFAAVTGLVEMSDAEVAGDLAVTGKASASEALVLSEQAASPFDAAGKHTLWAKDTVPTTLWMTDDAGNDYQVSTTTTQTLEAVLVLGNATSGSNIIVSSGDALIGEPDGGGLYITGAEGAASGAGGSVLLYGGSGGVTDGMGGSIFVAAGSAQNGDSDGGILQLAAGGSAGAGQPGYVQMTAADAVSGDIAGGDITISSGRGSGTAAGGAVSVTAGAGGAGVATGAGGTATLLGGAGGGTSGAGGAAAVRGGAASAGNSAGGNASLIAGAPSGSGAAGAIAITAAAAVSSNTVGGAVAITGGAGSGNLAGGAITGVAGAGGATGTGGNATLTAGAGGGTSGTGGNAGIFGGAGTNGNANGGDALGVGGAGQGAGTGGTAGLTGGAGGATGTGGVGRVRGGAGGASSGTGGAAQVTGGAGTAATATGGAAVITGGAGGSGAATGGAASLTSGAGGGTSGNSGAVTIASGAVTSGTRGTITLDGSDVIVTNQGYHSVRGATARGGTNTLIYRWTTVVDNVGTDITYTDSANNGGSWAINNAGMYTVSCSIVAGHNGYVAIKKAAAVSNTFDATDIMVAHTVATNNVSMSWTGYCAAGDDIWIATDTATNPTTPTNNNRCTVARVR